MDLDFWDKVVKQGLTTKTTFVRPGTCKKCLTYKLDANSECEFCKQNLRVFRDDKALTITKEEDSNGPTIGALSAK